MMRSQTDEMLAAKYDPEPFVDYQGQRVSAEEEQGNGLTFDPRPEFIPGRHITRSAEGYGYMFEDRTYPEPNPILVEWRTERETTDHPDGLSWLNWVARAFPIPDWTDDQIDHARKVLTRLAAFA